MQIQTDESSHDPPERRSKPAWQTGLISPFLFLSRDSWFQFPLPDSENR
jgi:hypothetical protein